MRTPILLAISLFLLILSGCTTFKEAVNPYNEQFKCRAKGDSGQCIDTPAAYDKARHPETDGSAKEITTLLKQQVINKRYHTVSNLLRQPEKPMLQPPKILRVLLLPYESKDEELFMSRYVYLKIKKSDWLLTELTDERG